ncbi:hypothetical protein OQY15_18840 [Pedobacter sp. MC2016-15]|uniref:hypothetical protein n=1 Tax=Pedobacter sp. MC2016-15 TaxID=2994473 RepID=UPI002248156B|nr:hypothetical protein [Pedobacter sp. MC2016-15]MCX2481169.1 hypothetical protein [Pedobacter sp. MC2016-15]
MKEQADGKSLLKKAVWAYFLLLIFEGALRKWVLPGLSTPILLIRDPLAIWILFKVWEQGKMPSSIYLKAMALIGVVSIVTAMLAGHGNFGVAIYGARIILIHFPLMFAIGKVFDREDVLQMARTIIWISIPMVVLIAMQFYSPQSAFVNRGVGGNMEGGGFSGAMGFFRPPGTFSFTNGNVSFFSLTASLVIYFWLTPGINKLVLIAATIAVLAAIPLSISRTLFFSIGVALIFAISATLFNGKNTGKIITTGFILVIALAILSQLPFFSTATEAFTARFTNANETEGGVKGVLGDRYFGGLGSALSNSTEQPFFGFGVGMGTNVGSNLLTGASTFLISEEEWGRLIGEMGAIMGIGFIVVRLGVSFRMLSFGYKQMLRGDLLPWMLLSFALLNIPQGQWAQPTNLGFSAMIGGLLFASFNTRKKIINENQPEAAIPALPVDLTQIKYIR